MLGFRPGRRRAQAAALAAAAARYDPARRLCFMHVPKAAGTALAVSLRQALGGDAPGATPADVVVRGFDHVLFGGFDGFATLGAEQRAEIYDAPEAMPRAQTLVCGHFALTTLRAAYPGAQLVTVLREPVSRLLSHWMFWRKQQDDALAGWGRWGDVVRQARRPLREFIAEPQLAAQTDNVTLRMLLWPNPMVPAGGFIDPAHDAELLREARRRLDGFALAEIVEGPVVPRLAAWLGREVTCRRLNETADMPEPQRTPLDRQLDAATLALLDERSRLDLALWRGIALRRDDAATATSLRRQTILAHVARYAALMATG